MNYDILTGDQDENLRAYLAEGLCSFTVLLFKESQSKAGNPIVGLYLECVDKNQRVGKIWVSIMLTGDFSWRWRHFCQSIGKIEKYERGTISEADVIDARGCLILKMGKARGSYEARLEAVDYVLDDSRPKVSKYDAIPDTSAVDSDIPF